FWETINEIEGSTGKFTFSLTQAVNCNSTATGGPGLGTPDDGIIESVFVFTATFDTSGSIQLDEPYTGSQTTTFHDCLIAGDILDLATAPRIRVNGSLTWRVSDLDGQPLRGSLTGNLGLSTDKDGDGTFDDPFWGENLNANATLEYDGGYAFNGGVCIGSTVEFGEDDEDDDDDDCAIDEDALPEGFIPAGSCGVFPLPC
ncbi:MAG: hypothetical protein AB1405_10790, partial [Bdellovibrionota bacterium]